MSHKRITSLFFFLLINVICSAAVYAQDSDELKFAVTGCMHFTGANISQCESAIEKIKESKPDFVLFLGGMVDAGNDTPVEAIWKEFDRLTNKLNVPAYNVPGDCRLIPLSLPRDNIVLMRKCFIDRYKKNYYSFEYGNNLFICLDSESIDLYDKERGTLKGSQLDFLKKQLLTASKYDNVFIGMNRSPWFQANGRWFEEIHPLIKGKVKCVFGAGLHQFGHRKIGGVSYVTIGSPLEEPALTSPSYGHFLTVDLRNKEVSLKIALSEPIPLEDIKGSLKNKPARSLYLNSQLKFKEDILNSDERMEILKPDLIVDSIKVKPGMNIADIGAGTGIFTFLFAKALKGTGNVYATDVDEAAVARIKQKAQKADFKNISAVTVSAEGGDRFYKEHLFDVIFLCGVYDSILHPKDYFSRLRPSLVKDSGRLYIVHFRNISDFSPVEFGNFRKVIGILNSEGLDFPVFKKLDKETQSFIRNCKDGDIPLSIQAGIIRGFNGMLNDRFLVNDLVDYYSARKNSGVMAMLEYFLYELDVRLAKWLIIELDSRGVFSKDKKVLSREDKRDLSKLNRILITGIFKSDMLYWISTRRFCVEKESIISKMKEAGYEFAGEQDFLTHYYFLEFKRRY